MAWASSRIMIMKALLLWVMTEMMIGSLFGCFNLHLCWYGGNDGQVAGCVWSFALAIISHVPFTTWAIVASIVFLFDILRFLYVAWNSDCLIQR